MENDEAMQLYARQLSRDALEAENKRLRAALSDLHDDIQERIGDGARFNPGTMVALEQARQALSEMLGPTRK